MMKRGQVIELSGGSGLQNNYDVTRIYTSLQPNDDGTWDVVTVVETRLALDPGAPDYQQERCDRLVRDIEADLRSGELCGRVKIKAV